MRSNLILLAILVTSCTAQASDSHCRECEARCPNRALSIGSRLQSGVRHVVGLARKVARKFVTDESDALDYLMKFRYVNMDSMELMDYAENFQQSAVQMFQMMANIPVSGVVDDKTREMMNTPRCGVADKMGERRKRRYALDGSSWPRLRLSYRINQYSNKVERAALQRLVENAFQMWSDVSALTFHELHEDVDMLPDIEIKFINGTHGDGRPFDGPGRTVGHAFPPLEGKPGLAGDIHFDDEEPWTIGSSEGQGLLQSMVHEIGHALGLAHSMVKGSVMWPFSSAYNPEFALHEDDITAIQAIYGTQDDPKIMVTEASFDPFQPEAPVTEGFVPDNDSLDVPEVCIPHIERLNCLPDPPFNTLESTMTTKTSSYTTSETTSSTTSITTSSTSEIFTPSSCLSSLNAITRINTSILAFKGNHVYAFTSTGVHEDYPKQIDEVFPDGPLYVDVAFTTLGRRRYQRQEPLYLYLFRGNQFFKYSGDLASGFVKEGSGNYHDTIQFRGLPAELDAAFSLQQGDVMFLKGSNHYRWSYYSERVRRANISPVTRTIGFPINAAVLITGRWFFFKPDGTYYRYEVQRREGKLLGPRSTQRYWFRCQQTLTSGVEPQTLSTFEVIQRYNPFEVRSPTQPGRRGGRRRPGRRGR